MIETSESRARLTHDLMTVDRMIAHHEVELGRQWGLRGDLRARLGETLPPVASVPQEPVGPPEQPPGTSEPVPGSEVDSGFTWFDGTTKVPEPEPDPNLDSGRHHWIIDTFPMPPVVSGDHHYERVSIRRNDVPIHFEMRWLAGDHGASPELHLSWSSGVFTGRALCGVEGTLTLWWQPVKDSLPERVALCARCAFYIPGVSQSP